MQSGRLERLCTGNERIFSQMRPSPYSSPALPEKRRNTTLLIINPFSSCHHIPLFSAGIQL